ncbi:MAG: hypothetical protein AAF519_06080 [Bacteroidota bacterium]
MIKIIISLLLLLLTTSPHLTAQDEPEIHLSSQQGEASLGLGIGLPYGVFGARLGYNVANQVNLFGGLGYNLVGVGYNFGLQYSFPSSRQSEFYLMGMYGNNAVIIVDGGGFIGDFEESYFGPSFGAGLKINSVRKEGNYWDVGLIVPIRSSDFNDDFDLFDAAGVDFNTLLPVLITVGYNFNIR